MTTSELKTKLSKSVDHLQDELSQVRTGRATPALLENIHVDAYGTKMSVKELGSINVADAQNLVVSVWDKGLLPAVAASIRESDLKVNPVIDGNSVRVPIPALTEDRRKEFVKIVSVKVEEAKNSMRNVRQEAMKDIDKRFNDKQIGEDEKFTQKDEIEDVVKKFIEEADELGESKKTDLMTI
jgi:ribosome recycling factor